MTPLDLTNALFELIGGLCALYNCRVLWRDKQIHGVSPWSSLFFTSWSMWNLYFYASLDQMLSTFGSVSLALANLLWVALMIHYRVRGAR